VEKNRRIEAESQRIGREIEGKRKSNWDLKIYGFWSIIEILKQENMLPSQFWKNHCKIIICSMGIR